MNLILSPLVESPPWIATLLGWLLLAFLVILLWVIVSFPAHLVELFIRQARKDTALFATGLAHASRQRSAEMRGPLSPFELFYHTHRFRYLVEENRSLWKRTVERVVEPINSLKGVSEKACQALVSATEAVGQATRQLETVAIGSVSAPGNQHVITAVDSNLEDLKAVRRARANLVLSLILILGLVTVNAGMLSQVLKDVLDVGSRRIVGELRLYHLLALFATLSEAGLGMLHASLGAERRGTSDRLFTGQGVVAVAAVGLGLVEGFFYSRLGASATAEGASIQLLGFRLGMDEAFFVMGSVLPLALAGFGRLFYRSLMTIRDGYAVKELHAQLQAIHNAVMEADASLKRARQQGREASDVLAQPSQGRRQEVVTLMNETTRTLRDLKDTQPQWATTFTAPLTDEQVHHEVLRSAVWLALTVLTAGLAVGLQAAALSPLYFPPGTTWTPWVAAVAQVVALLCTGFLLRASPVAIEDRGYVRPIGTHRSTIARLLAVLIAAVVLVYDLSMMSRQPVAVGGRVVWILVIGIGACLVALGRELPSILAVGVGCLSAIFRGLRELSVLVAVWLLRGVAGLLLLIEFVLGFVAIPARWILTLRARRGVVA